MISSFPSIFHATLLTPFPPVISLAHVGPYRARARIPAAVWRHPRTGAVLMRSSQVCQVVRDAARDSTGNMAKCNLAKSLCVTTCENRVGMSLFLQHLL